MKRQKTKAEKLQIKANAVAFGVSESAIAIVGSLVLVHRIDPHILALMPPHLPSMQHAAKVPNGIKLCSKSKWQFTDDDKLMLAMLTHKHVESLKRGDISDRDYALLQTTLQIGMESLSIALPELDNQQYCKQRYKEAYHAAKSMLDDMNERRDKVGSYKATGDNIRCIEVLIGLLNEAVEFITVGEWYSAMQYLVESLTRISIENEKEKMKQAA